MRLMSRVVTAAVPIAAAIGIVAHRQLRPWHVAADNLPRTVHAGLIGDRVATWYGARESCYYFEFRVQKPLADALALELPFPEDATPQLGYARIDCMPSWWPCTSDTKLRSWSRTGTYPQLQVILDEKRGRVFLFISYF